LIDWLIGGVSVWRAVGNPQLTTISLASTCLLHEWQPNTLQKTQNFLHHASADKDLLSHPKWGQVLIFGTVTIKSKLHE